MGNQYHCSRGASTLVDLDQLADRRGTIEYAYASHIAMPHCIVLKDIEALREMVAN